MRRCLSTSRGVTTLALTTLFFALTLPRAARAQLPISADSIAKLRTISTFAFKARIDSLGASTVAEIPRSPHTIAVTPTAALQCPHAVGQYVSQPMTIYVDDATGLAPQQTWWFFAYGWVMGKGLAVREIVRVPGTYADSVLQRQFLGPTGPRAMIERHLQDTVVVVIGALALDTIRPRVAGLLDLSTLHYTVPLRVSSTLFAPPGWAPPAGSNVRVIVPATGIKQWSHLRVPDAFQHRVFFLHTTIGVPGDIVSGPPPKPPFMLIGPDDVAGMSDSALVASIVATKPRPVLGSRSPNFVPQCGVAPR